MSSSEAQKEKASALLADRTGRFSTVLDKKNWSLSRSKVTTNKLKANVDEVKADKQATVEALKAEVERRVEAEKDKRDEDAKSADKIREKMLNKMKVSMNV